MKSAGPKNGDGNSDAGAQGSQTGDRNSDVGAQGSQTGDGNSDVGAQGSQNGDGNSGVGAQGSQTGGGRPDDDALCGSLDGNIARLRRESGGSADIKYRELHIALGDDEAVRATVIYTEGMSDAKALVDSLLNGGGRRPYRKTDRARETSEEGNGQSPVIAYLTEHVIADAGVVRITTLAEAFDHLLSGDSVLLIEGESSALSVETKKVQARQVEEPNVQTVVRGPREGFTEVLSWNMAMLRRKIKDRRLWMESRQVGAVTKTEILIVYIQGIVAQEVLDEVRSRLDGIDIDGILESNYIEEFIQDKKYSIFPTIANSERPDVVAAQLLEGRVAILVDGTPFALIVPAFFTQMFQSPEDYYQRTVFSSLVRLLRMLAFCLAMFTPSLFIAITTFHIELVPTTLLYNLASQREGVPFPAFIEALIMEVTFEILREASVRMPRTIGQSISVVGTLVIGQAAVEAGLATAAMVIVVSITAIANFVMPAFNLGIAVRISRFLFMMVAASFGLYGLFLAIIALVVRLCTLQSFGVPYMAPLAPFNRPDQKDTLWRLPIPSMKKRPLVVQRQNIVRQRKV